MKSISSALAISMAAAGLVSFLPFAAVADSDKRPVIVEARPAAGGSMLQVRGANFPAMPKVTLGTVPGSLAVTLATPAQVDVVIPADLAPGSYLLTLSDESRKKRDNGDTDRFDEFWVTIGGGGAEGPQGPQGPQGPMGSMGPMGPMGPAGPQGTAGATGPQGPSGEPGVAGPQGLQGVPGVAGPAGPQGPAGITRIRETARSIAMCCLAPYTGPGQAQAETAVVTTDPMPAGKYFVHARIGLFDSAPGSPTLGFVSAVHCSLRGIRADGTLASLSQDWAEVSVAQYGQVLMSETFDIPAPGNEAGIRFEVGCYATTSDVGVYGTSTKITVIEAGAVESVLR